MVGIEAFDELLAVNILLVCRAAVPKMGVPVDDENLFTLGCPVHGDFSLLPHADSSVMRLAIGAAGSVRPAPAPAGIVRGGLQMMYFIISFMSPNSMTVLSSIMTMRP